MKIKNREGKFLYRHFNKEGRLLYIGACLRLMTRTADHEVNSSWFDDVVKVTVERFLTAEEALIAEKKAIEEEMPLYNIHHNKFVFNNLVKEEIILPHNQWLWLKNRAAHKNTSPNNIISNILENIIKKC